MIAFYEARKDDDMARDSRHGKRRLQCSAHLHHHIELVLLISGKAVAFADTTRYELEAGDLFIAFPNQIHRYETEGGERYFLFIVNPDLIPELAKIFTGSIPCSSLLRNAATPELIHLMEQLTKPWDDQKYRDMARRGYYLAMFSEILAKLELTTTLPDDSGALRTIIRYCTSNYQRELTLSTLEKELHLSRYYISHLFSDKLHIAFNDYINSLRVSGACHYLRHSDLTVTAIAEQVGFGTTRTFNRAFLRQMDCSPMQYRKRNQK